MSHKLCELIVGYDKSYDLKPGERAIRLQYEHEDGTDYYARELRQRARDYAEAAPVEISDDDPLVVLGLGIRIDNVLERHGCRTVADVRHSVREMDGWRGCGPDTQAKVYRALGAV